MSTPVLENGILVGNTLPFYVEYERVKKMSLNEDESEGVASACYSCHILEPIWHFENASLTAAQLFSPDR